MISWLYCVLLLQKLLIFAGEKKKKRRLNCRNWSAAILWWQERCSSMQVYSYVTHNCSETIFKTGLKEITGMIQRSCLLTNLLGWHARKVEESRDRSCSDWGREGSRASPENGAQKHPFALGFPGTPYKDAVLLTVTSRSEVSRSGAPASLIFSLLICCCPARKVHKTMRLCLFLLQDELVPLLYQLSVFVEPKAMGSAPDSACG